MIWYTFFDDSGKILQNEQKSTPPDISQYPNGWDFIEGRHIGFTHYILNALNGPLAIPRPEMTAVFDKAQIAANGIEVITLSGLPDPCTVIYEGPGFRLDGEVTGGTAEFTTDAPGAHRVKVTAWPHLAWEGGFDAV